MNLTREEQIRLEALKAAAHAYASTGSTRYTPEVILEVAQKFTEYVIGPPNPNAAEPDRPEISIVYDKLGNKVSSSDDFPVDLTGCTLIMEDVSHVHLPRQHRDGKPPWCDRCGLTKELLVPRSSIPHAPSTSVEKEH